MRGGDTAGEKKKYHDALHTQVAYKHEKNIQRRKDDQVLVAVEVVAVDVASVFVNVVDAMINYLLMLLTLILLQIVSLSAENIPGTGTRCLLMLLVLLLLLLLLMLLMLAS